MPYFTSPNQRISGPLPRRDILAICAHLNRNAVTHPTHAPGNAETFLDRLAAAARMQ